jgi:hypothetical protein
MVLLGGCCTTRCWNDPVAQYRKKHPDEARRYSVLNPVNLVTYAEVAGWAMGSTTFTRQLREKFGHVQGVNEFADQAVKNEFEAKQLFTTLFRGLEQAASGGGVVCQFEWSDGKTKETGLLAIRSGEVVKRERFLREYPREDKQKQRDLQDEQPH